MKTEKDTVKRIDLKGGDFATISNKIMFDYNLTSDAFRLMIILLNNAESWEINTGHFARKLKWGPKKLTAALTCLQENGYVSKKWNGKEWHYTISEVGGLEEKTNRSTSTESAPEPSIPIAETPLPTHIKMSVDELKAFSSEYNENVYQVENYCPPAGKYFFINMRIDKGEITSKEQIIEAYAN